jgi:DNA-binding SARP family transcriptional activator
VAADSIHIRLLGAFVVSIDRHGVAADAWPGRRSSELVQLLALADGHRLSRDQVIEALWPHLDVDAGAANLRKAAHHARRVLGDPDAVVLRGGQVALFPGSSVSTDAADFESAARAALRSGDVEAAQGVADRFGGELLPAALYEDWSQAPRDRLRALYGELLRLGGQWQRLVEEDPTEEQAYRALMREALAAGRRHTAIAHYGRLRTALRTELGVLPSAETEAVYAECLTGLEADVSGFVGRQIELSLLTARMESRAGDDAGVMAVRGPAGIGKSALCKQAARIARDEGWKVITVAAGASEGPYAALSAAIEHVLWEAPDALDEAGHRESSVLAGLTSMINPPAPLDVPMSRHQVIGAARRLLTAAAGGTGCMVIIDDAHLADEATLDAILHLGDFASAPILTVLAYRPEGASDTLRRGVARLVRAGTAIEIDLAPLGRDEAVALATAAGVTDRETTVTEIVDLAEGNPFFVLELARSAVAGAPLRIGASRRDAIAVRFADLDDGAAAMLRRLALAGDDLELLSVLALTGSTEDEAFGMLDQALASGVLVVADGRYRFGHDLVRQAMIDEIPPHQRVAIHRDAARRLTDSDGAPGQIAHHWLDGRRADLAVPWLLIAARRSVELGAFQDALGYLDPLLGHDAGHTDALLLRAESLDALGDHRALSAYADAARSAGEPAAHEIVPRQALAQIKQGDPAGALRTLEGSAPVTVEGRLAEALTLSGAAALGFGDPALGAARAAESRRLALESGDRASLVVASWANAAAAHARGDLRGSVRIDLRETHALPKLAVSVFDGQLCITQRLLYGAHPYSDVIAFAESLASEAQRLGAARGHAFAKTIGGEAKLLSGCLDDAELDLAEGERLHHAIAAPTGEAFSLERRAEVAMHQGRPTDARALLDDALAMAQESDVGFHLFDRIYGARITTATEPDAGLVALEDAEASVHGPIETCPGCRITLAVPAAIAAARAGDLGRAAQYEQETEFLAEVVMRLPAWYAALDEVRGHIALAKADIEAGMAHFAKAADAYRIVGQPLDEARCRALITQ